MNSRSQSVLKELQIEKGVLTSKLNFAINFEKAQTIKLLVQTQSKLRQFDRVQTNFQRNQQDKNSKIFLNQIYELPLEVGHRKNASSPLPPLDYEELSMRPTKKREKPNRKLIIKRRRQMIETAVHSQVSVQKYSSRSSQIIDKKEILQNFFAKKSKPVNQLLHNSQMNETRDEQQQSNDINNYNQIEIQQAEIRNVKHLNEIQETLEKQILKKGAVLNKNFFMNTGKYAKGQKQEKNINNLLEIKKTEAQKNFENMVEFFDQKKIRELASEFQYKRYKRDYSKIRQELKNALIYIHKLKLHPKDLLTNEIFSWKPFQKTHAYDFIYAAKIGNMYKVKELIMVNKYLVYDFDYIYMTSLHWACKRCHLDIVQFLIENGADIDFQDIIGRTPLYFAIVGGSYEIVELLLDNQANPWSTTSVNYNDVCREYNPDCLVLLSKARKLHISLRMTPLAMRVEIWRKQVLQSKKRNF